MTQTLGLASRRNVALFSDDNSGEGITHEFDSAGALTSINGVPVFRSGTFRDSMGFQHQWDDIHMDQMIANFAFLKDRRIFEDVPVRVGHPSFLGADPVLNLVGYVTGLRKEMRKAPHDGKEYSYLIADFEVLNQEYAEKITSGLFRNRSSEIGGYITNDEMELWPTFMGFAYVDIPAVEGLNFSKNHPSQKFSILLDNPNMKGEEAVADENTPGTKQPPKPPTLAKPVEAATTQEHSASRPSFTFKIAGQETTDFQAVQAHIEVLETAAKEQQEQARTGFVDELFSSNKILASQVENFKKLALGMGADQFQIFRESFEGVTGQPVLAEHSQGSQQAQGGHLPQTPPEDAAATQIIQDREILFRHRDSGLNPDAIKRTMSYKRLAAANSVPAGF